MKVSYFEPCKSRAVTRIFAFLICFIMIAGQASAQTADVRSGSKTKTDASGPTPEWSSTWTGSFTCKAVNDSTATELAHITTDNELRLEYTPSSTPETFTYTSSTGSKPRTLVGTPDTGNTMTTDNNSSRNSLDWTSTKAIGAVLVGGSGGNRIYWMPEGSTLGTQFSGTGFQNVNGSTITKVAFCYHEPAKVTIIKQVQIFGGTASDTSFPFTSTNMGANNFSLVDNDSVGPDRKITANLYKFAKWGQNITVTESLVQYWSLSDLSCSDTHTVPDQTSYANVIDFANRKVTIKLEEGEQVTCTYTNTSLIPTAAQVEIAGRVVDENGSGIRGAQITIFDANALESRTVVTNPFGYYKIENVDAGNFYIITVRHKSFSFPDGQRSFTVTDAVSDLDFVGIR